MAVKKIKFKIGRIILILFTSLVFGFGVYNCNAQSLTGNTLPMPFGVGVGVVMSGSMEPDLNVDDVIIVKKSKDYAVNDWVVFQQRGMLVVHEVTSVDGDTFITKGTANNAEDEPINRSQIKGKVVFSIPKIGVVVKWIKSPIGTIIILAFAGLLLIKSYSDDKKDISDDDEVKKIKQEIEELKKSLASEQNSKQEELK